MSAGSNPAGGASHYRRNYHLIRQNVVGWPVVIPPGTATLRRHPPVSAPQLHPSGYRPVSPGLSPAFIRAIHTSSGLTTHSVFSPTCAKRRVGGSDAVALPDIDDAGKDESRRSTTASLRIAQQQATTDSRGSQTGAYVRM